jgi:PAS domain S-box-containing protein
VGYGGQDAVDAEDGARDRVAAARRLVPTVPAPGDETAALNRLSRLAARLLRTSSAQVSVLTDVQTVAGGVGLGAAAVGTQWPAADSLCRLVVSGNVPLVVPDARADDRVYSLQAVSTGNIGAYLGVPLHTESGVAESDVVVGALCVYDEAPRSWAREDVELLEELSYTVMAQLELEALSREYEEDKSRHVLALEAAGVGIFDWDLKTDDLAFDEQLEKIFGYEPGTFPPRGEEFFAHVHPQDRESVDLAIASAMADCGDYRAEYRIVRASGEVRWLAERGRALAGPNGTAARLLGATSDITTVRTARDEAERLLESMVTAFFAVDRQWRVTYLNTEGERVLGRRRQDLLGRNLWEEFPGAEELEFGRLYKRAMEAREIVTFEDFYPLLDAWYEVRAQPQNDGLGVYFLDITERRRAQQRLERAASRAELVAKVTSDVASTLDPLALVAGFPRLVVPALADWCVVTVLGNDGKLRDLESWHADPALRPLVRRYADVRQPALKSSSFVGQSLRTGQPVTIGGGATEAIAEVLEDGAARDLLYELAPSTAAVLPLRAHGRTVGLITLFGDPGRDLLEEENLSTAIEIAGRAGIALDNARLYAQQRQLAETLQRSLLTAPPEPDHLQIVARYQPAAEAAQVGGDWYDAFLQSDGSTVLVIGDVVGHDTDAAAAMGQLRALLRGISYHTGAGPAETLTGIDAAMLGLLIQTTATAVVARLEQTDQEKERGVTRLRWSNAGHLPPMVVHPGGQVTALTGSTGGLLLGINPDTVRVDSEVALERDATVLLYTDGLVERRDRSLDDGLASLKDTLADLAELSLDDLCDALLGRLLPSSPEDDVALLAVRLHPQDRPRPPEAGPNRVPPTVEEG